MQLQRVREVFDHPGPFVSLHVEVGRGTEDAAAQIDARWTSIRHQLEHAGIEASLVEEIGERLRQNVHAPGEARRSLVATQDKVVLDEVQQGHSHWPESTSVGPLPDLSGWLTTADREIPVVVVVADREGADIDAYDALSTGVAEHDQVQGRSYYLTKVSEGDWAQKQFQQTAENRWHENATEVVEHVRSVLRRHPARLVVVAGDVRARSDIAGQLEGIDAAVVSTEAGGRAPGASQEALWVEVDRALAEVQAARDTDVLDALAAARAQGEGSVSGLPEVVPALARAQVERLVLDLGALEDKTVDPRAHDGLALPAGALDQSELPAGQVLVAAGVLTGADIALLPAEIGGGGGAAGTLRWVLGSEVEGGEDR